MDNKEKILLNTLDVLLSIEDDFIINMRRYGDEDVYPRWTAQRDEMEVSRNLTLKKYTYKVYLKLNENDKFDIVLNRTDRWFDFLRRESKRYKFTTWIGKTDEKHRQKFANSRAVEISFDYSKKEYQDIQRKIFDYFEEKNDYDLNYAQIKREEAIDKKANECADILKSSVGKKKKREYGINEILNDEN
jgi:hypothetical protein